MTEKLGLLGEEAAHSIGVKAVSKVLAKIAKDAPTATFSVVPGENSVSLTVEWMNRDPVILCTFSWDERLLTDPNQKRIQDFSEKEKNKAIEEAVNELKENEGG